VKRLLLREAMHGQRREKGLDNPYLARVKTDATRVVNSHTCSAVLHHSLSFGGLLGCMQHGSRSARREDGASCGSWQNKHQKGGRRFVWREGQERRNYW
jgi:hypothetical protein